MSTDSGSARVRNLLLADSSLSALVGSDVYAHRFDGAPETPSVMFFVQAARIYALTPFREQSLQFHCYQATTELAWALYEVVKEALIGDFTDPSGRKTLWQSFNIVQIKEEQDGQEMIDELGPDKGSPYILAMFTVQFIRS